MMTTKPASVLDTSSGQRKLRFLTRVFPADQYGAWALTGQKLIIGRDPGQRGIELDDDQASRQHAAIDHVSASDVYRVVDKKSRNGTFLNGQRIESDYMQAGSVLRIGGTLFVYGETRVPPGFEPSPPESGSSVALAVAEHMANLAAPGDDPIIVTGPTGAGKERIAERIHQKSGRTGKFVAVNCATLNRELIGSEMFGHKKGAFSGANRDRKGLFLEADGGTLFLDEIAELPLEQQAAFLRVLQEKKIRPVGSDSELDVDVRIVAATHQDLERMCEAGTFRSDLYARLAGVLVEIDGLGRRKEEILPLFSTLTGGIDLTLAAAEALLSYDWPRNIRELQQVARRIKLFGEAVEVADVDLLPDSIQNAARTTTADPKSDVPTRELLTELLTTHEGNIAQVCRALGKHRQQVYRWLKQYKLSPEDFRSGS